MSRRIKTKSKTIGGYFCILQQTKDNVTILFFIAANKAGKVVDIANSTHILKTVIHGTKKDEEDPKYFSHNYYNSLQFLFQGSLQWKMGP